MRPFKKRVKKRITKEQKLRNLCDETLKKLKEIPKNDLTKVVKLIRGFFAKIFKVSYNFSPDQIEQVVNTKKISSDIKDKIKELSEEISFIQYGKEKPTEDLKTNIYDKFETIIKNLSELSQTKKDKESNLLIEKILPKINKISGTVMHILKNINKPGRRIPFEYISKIKTPNMSKKPSRLYNHIFYNYELIKDGKIIEAKHQYGFILKAYLTIPEKEKKRYYFHIKKLYEKITSS